MCALIQEKFDVHTDEIREKQCCPATNIDILGSKQKEKMTRGIDIRMASVWFDYKPQVLPVRSPQTESWQAKQTSLPCA